MQVGEHIGGGWALRSPHRPPVLEQLHRYRVLGRLGVGGMAEIFLARDAEDPARRAVIKRMLPNIVDDTDLVTMFLDEARLGMRLSHPNLCHFFGAGHVDGRPCIAMEWVNGVTFEELVARAARFGGLPLHITLRIAADIAGALEFVHRARDESGEHLGIVHRDVTPKNMMVAFDGGVKLLDFGLAKSKANHAVTQPGMAKGKFAYLAPELWQGGTADPRADVWALGVSLFETIVGRPLFHRARPIETMRAIVDEPVPLIRDYEPGAPAALDALLRRCLARDPEERFASAAELQTAIDALLIEIGERPTASDLEALLADMFAPEMAAGPELEPTDFELSGASEPEVLHPVDPHARRRAALEPTEVIRTGGDRDRRSGTANHILVGVGALLLGGLCAWIGSLGVSESSVELPTMAAAPPSAERSDVVLEAPPTRVATASAPLEAQPEAEAEPSASVPSEPDTHPRHAEIPRVRPRRRGAPTPRSFGVLHVNSQPWSQVLVDGEPAGYTPLGNLRVSSGSHRLTFVDAEGNTVERRAQVPEDGAARLFVRFPTE